MASAIIKSLDWHVCRPAVAHFDFRKWALEGINVKDLITNVGSGVGAGAPAGTAAAGCDAAPAAGEAKKEENKKEEEPEESDDDMGFALFD
ncbi:60S acidic ribosomal protein P1-like [Lucilia sericata]|uniref:60S acidic ribosomal protein P1-like n=1 Tax=Lucilia sericata TaxID=13632 RepID=UPI0018A864E6|nr:60S acidic ribosomal protein P1-like [Lucilia sericata]